MKSKKWKDAILTVTVLGVFFILSLGITEKEGTHSVVPALFSLAIFLISYFTNGYFWGIAASLVSMLAVNYAFTFPYFKLNFSMPANLISSSVMLIITIMTSALTTKLKNQEKLKAEHEKETMRANLLRAVSHDLRTPLTTIYGSSSAMIEHFEKLSDSELMQLAGGIKEDAEWLIGMVENLLSVTRTEGSNMKLNKAPAVLEELIDSVLVRFQKKYPKQHVELEMPDEFISIPMDSVLITQVIVNMLENSVQHAKGMTKLKLRVYTSGNQAIFEVSDDGCGIPKDQIDKIFTGYFERKDAPADNQKRCMGIGLTACSSVIKAHGGEITAENLKEGGCCFRFNLKMEEE